jgi:multidrug efflux pump subunit AcrA (membrane-fusion protein)
MNKLIIPLTAMIIFALSGCKNSTENASATDQEVKTPVTITTIERSSISESIQLSATSAYLKKNQVKANVTGYIEKSLVRAGEYVQAGKPMFYIRTKEAEALSRFHSSDTSFNIKGLIEIKAPESGIVTEVNKYVNDYTTDGDALATIAQQNSFVFLLNVPYELKKYATIGSKGIVVLPDSTRLNGTVVAQLSTVDPVSQTQLFIVKVILKQNLPENLVASVFLVKNTRQNAQVVDKTTVLSDETMENFWVMKLINDSIAVKVPVQKGISTDQKIEIISPVFSPGDRIIYSGQYGLPDTAFVMINK